jgi:hypothetical protein
MKTGPLEAINKENKGYYGIYDVLPWLWKWQQGYDVYDHCKDYE